MRLPKKLLSYSSVSLFNKTKTRREWIKKYIYGEPTFVVPEMAFGRRVSDNLDKDSFFAWDEDLRDTLCKCPMYGTPEEIITLQQKSFAVIGYLDRATEDYSRVLEFKTGKVAWDQERVDSALQLESYAWLIYDNFNFIPEIELVWLETGGERSNLQLTGRVETFKRKVTIEEIDKTRQLFTDTAKEMSRVYQLYLNGHDLLTDAKYARELIKQLN